MCVERKSLSDLRQSFLSGRLYHQAEVMTKHYKTPILLIEFERDKAFALHATSEIGSDINVWARPCSEILLLCGRLMRLLCCPCPAPVLLIQA